MNSGSKNKFRVEEDLLVEVISVLRVRSSDLGLAAGASENQARDLIVRELDWAIRECSGAIDPVAHRVNLLSSQPKSVRIRQEEKLD
jgi:hypothetical protein